MPTSRHISAGSGPFSTITARTTSGARIRPARATDRVEHATFDFAGCKLQPSNQRITLAGITSGSADPAPGEQVDRGVDVSQIRAKLPELLFETGDLAGDLGRFSTSAETTWVSAMVFPDLDEIGVIINGLSGCRHPRRGVFAP